MSRAFWHSKDGWTRLTAGMEIEELWAQFKTEASESSRLYTQDVSESRRQAREILEAAIQDFTNSDWERSEKALACLADCF